MTYEEAFDAWISEKSLAVSNSTAYTYKKDAKNAVEFFNGQDVSKIARKNIIEFLKSEKEKNYLNSTIRIHFRCVKSVFEWLYNSEKISENPCKNIELPAKIYREINPFSQEEVEKLLNTPAPAWVHDAVEIAYRTGMRKGEIFALKWSDIDFENGFLQVRRTQSVYAGKMEIKEPKTKSSKRKILIDKHLIELLQRRASCSGSEFVFATKNGTPKVPHDLSCKRFKALCIRAGVKPRRFHDLRHTHASVLLSAGVHPKIVQERLGHASIKTTLDIYSHLLPSIQGAAVDVFNDL